MLNSNNIFLLECFLYTLLVEFKTYGILNMEDWLYILNKIIAWFYLQLCIILTRVVKSKTYATKDIECHL